MDVGNVTGRLLRDLAHIVAAPLTNIIGNSHRTGNNTLGLETDSYITPIF